MHIAAERKNRDVLQQREPTLCQLGISVGGFINDRAAYFTFFIQFRIGSVTVLSAVSGENTSDMWLCPLT